MKYRVIDLDGNLLFEAKSQPEIARKMGVSFNTVDKRIVSKVEKDAYFKKENTKFNIERIQNGNS